MRRVLVTIRVAHPPFLSLFFPLPTILVLVPSSMDAGMRRFIRIEPVITPWLNYTRNLLRITPCIRCVYINIRRVDREFSPSLAKSIKFSSFSFILLGSFGKKDASIVKLRTEIGTKVSWKFYFFVIEKYIDSFSLFTHPYACRCTCPWARWTRKFYQIPRTSVVTRPLRGGAVSVLRRVWWRRLR